MQVVLFEMGGQRYGLPSSAVRELVRAVAITRLPRAPKIVEGVIDVRGAVVPVLDIRSRFNVPPKPLEPSDHLILATAGSRNVALRVDQATALIEIDPKQIEDASAVVPGSEWVSGVVKLPDGLVLLHDLATFLSAAEAEELDTAMHSTGAIE